MSNQNKLVFSPTHTIYDLRSIQEKGIRIGMTDVRYSEVNIQGHGAGLDPIRGRSWIKTIDSKVLGYPQRAVSMLRGKNDLRDVIR